MSNCTSNKKTQTVDDVKQTFTLIKKADVRDGMARAMLSVGNLTDEARAYVAQEYPHHAHVKHVLDGRK